MNDSKIMFYLNKYKKIDKNNYFNETKSLNESEKKLFSLNISNIKFSNGNLRFFFLKIKITF